MEFMSRGGRNAAGTPNQPTGNPVDQFNKSAKRNMAGLESRYLFVVLVVGIGLLVASVALYSGLANNNSSTGEASLVKTDKYQAVFLTNGQVYFGKITGIDSRALVISDVFYIEAQGNTTAQQQAQNNNSYTLRKLGTSELHAPEDTMVVNREQVSFWENLKNEGRVVTAINEYKKNPSAANQVGNGNTQTTPSTNQNTTPTNNR